MATDGIKQLRTAAFARMTADSTLGNLVSGIYEYRGITQAYPHVYLGEMDGREWSRLASKGMDVEFTIEVATRDKDSSACGDILARLAALFHRQSFAITGYTPQFIRWQQSELNETATGYQGRARFLARLTEN